MVNNYLQKNNLHSTKAKFIDYYLEIIPLSPPKLIKDNKIFVCSEKFIVHSKNSLVDVWLAYQAEEDNSTWNMKILSRVNVKEMDKNLLNKFQTNDKRTVWQYAFDNKMIKKFNADFDLKSFNYQVFGPTVREILVSEQEEVIVAVSSKYYASASIKKFLIDYLNLKSNNFDKILIEESVILEIKDDRKIGKEHLFKINVEELIQHYQREYEAKIGRPASKL